MKSSANHSSKRPTAAIALVCFAYFVIAVVALYFLNPNYGLIRSFQGNYSLAPYEFLIASTFFGLGLGSLALTIGLHQEMSRPAESRIGLLLLGIWSIGILIAGVFPANEGGSTVPHMTTVLIAGIFPVETEASPDTGFSLIHTFVILGSFFSLSLAAILLSWRFKHEEKWHSIRHVSSILALAMLATFIYSCQMLLLPPEYIELGRKLLTTSSLLWLFLTVTYLRFVIVESVSKQSKDEQAR